jgi:hypothetical protein
MSDHGSRLPNPYKMDVWLAKFPLSQNMKVFVATVAIIGGTGYFFFKDFKTVTSKSGHDFLDSARPEAVFQAQDQDEKKRIAAGLPVPTASRKP